MSEYSERNFTDRKRLRGVAALNESALGAELANGWSVGAALCHMAFWDRFVAERWRVALEAPGLVVISGEVMTEIINAVNAAALPQWRALAPGQAAGEALAAAEEVDAIIESLPESALAWVQGRGRMVDRSLHRGPHLDEIEAALTLADTAPPAWRHGAGSP